MIKDDFLWVEKYRPKTIEECILPERTKKTFLEFLDRGEVPNLLLPGNYEVVVSSKLLSRFRSKNQDLTYFIALEPDSTFE